MFYFIVPLLPLQNVIYKLDTPFRGIPGLNILNLTTVLLLLAWIIYTKGRGRPMFAPSRYNRVLVAYMLVSYLGLWRSVSYVGAPPPLSPSDPSFVFWKDYITEFILFFAVANLIDDERRMKRLTFMMLLFLPYMFRVHRADLSWANSWHYDDDMRVNGTMMFLGSNELAAFYTMGLMVVIGLLTTARSLAWRLYLWGAAFFLGWGVIFSYSRSAYIASLLGLGMMAAVKNRKLGALMIVFVLAAPFILPASVQDRFSMIGSDQVEKDESSRRRVELWQVALDRFAENPILGTGFRSFPHLNKYGMDTHNMYLKVLCELGIFGIILYVAQFLMGLRQGWALLKASPTPFAAGLGLGLLAATAAAMFLNVFGDRSSYLAVTGHFWTWQAMASRILRAEEHEGGWTEAREAEV